jgi:hypothetical protein
VSFTQLHLSLLLQLLLLHFPPGPCGLRLMLHTEQHGASLHLMPVCRPWSRCKSRQSAISQPLVISCLTSCSTAQHSTVIQGCDMPSSRSLRLLPLAKVLLFQVQRLACSPRGGRARHISGPHNNPRLQASVGDNGSTTSTTTPPKHASKAWRGRPHSWRVPACARLPVPQPQLTPAFDSTRRKPTGDALVHVEDIVDLSLKVTRCVVALQCHCIRSDGDEAWQCATYAYR